MHCESCDTENRSGAKYCCQCGDRLSLPRLEEEEARNLTPETIDRIVEEYDHEIERYTQKMRWGEGLVGLVLFLAIALVLLLFGVYATAGGPSTLGHFSCVALGAVVLVIVVGKLSANAGWRERRTRVEDAKVRFLGSIGG